VLYQLSYVGKASTVAGSRQIERPPGGVRQAWHAGRRAVGQPASPARNAWRRRSTSTGLVVTRTNLAA